MIRSKFVCLITGVALLGNIVYPKVSFASSVDKCGSDSDGSCVKGSVSVKKDRTNWNLTVKDNKKDGHCAYAKMIIDRNNWRDEEIRSSNACGEGNSASFPGNVQYSHTRGARLEVCLDKNNRPDPCEKVHYEYESQ